MQSIHGEGYAPDLVRHLCRNPHATEWLEFKESNTRPDRIGTTVAALANGSALANRRAAYRVWGVSDIDHTVVGTSFSPSATRVGNEDFKPWLIRSLNPATGLRFHETQMDGRDVVVLEIESASHRPVAFKGAEYVRIGSANRKLKDHSAEEMRLWEVFNRSRFEEGTALDGLTSDDLWSLLDVEAYFNLLERPRPFNVDANLEYLERDRIIRLDATGRWEVTNAGVVLFAKDLTRFSQLRHKSVRIIEYDNSSRLHTRRQLEFSRGYASAFHDMVRFILVLLPAEEVMAGGLRRSNLTYPEIAVRELLANMLVHQDFSVGGARPMVEIFEGRIEFTNPGKPLVDTGRFVDLPSRTRNAGLASLMRRFGICEEQGSGIDKVVDAIEAHLLPAPRFDNPGPFTKVTLFGPKQWSDMTSDDRVWACCLHASLRYLAAQPANNKSVRDRFGLGPNDGARVSRLLRDAVGSGLLCLRDPGAGCRARSYLPWWTANGNGVFPVSI